MLMQAEFCMENYGNGMPICIPYQWVFYLVFFQYGNNAGFSHSMEKLWKKPTHRFPRGVADVYLPFFSYADDMR